jgi:hypothetical protein
MKYFRSPPEGTIEEAAQRAITMAQGIGESVEFEYQGRVVIVTPTSDVGKVCGEWTDAKARRHYGMKRSRPRKLPNS